nr:hypothetical protein [Tanacetum cinerariifolium]
MLSISLLPPVMVCGDVDRCVTMSSLGSIKVMIVRFLAGQPVRLYAAFTLTRLSLRRVVYHCVYLSPLATGVYDIERSDLGGNIGVLGNVTTDIESCGTSDQIVFLIIYFTGGHLTTTTTSVDNVGSPGESYTPLCSLLNPVSRWGDHMVAAITDFWCRLHTRMPEPPSCGLPLHIHVSTRNRGSKPVRIWKGLILRGLILEGILVFLVTLPLISGVVGHQINHYGFWCRLHTCTLEPSPCGLPLHIHVSTRNEGSKPVGNTKGSDIERFDLGGNIGVLGGHLTTTTTSIDNVGSLGESYTPLWSDIERFDLGENIGVLGNVTTDIGSYGSSDQGDHMVAAITGFWCHLHTRMPDPPLCGLPLHIHVSTRNRGSKPVGIWKGLILRGLILEGILAFLPHGCSHYGFWCRLHTRTPEPSPCGFPLHIHVSTRNGGSKPVGNTEGSDIERSDLGGNICVLGNVTTDIRSCGTSSQIVFFTLYFTVGHLTTTTTSIDNVGSDIERFDLGGNIDVLGNVTTDFGSCGTSDQDASFRKCDWKITDFLCNMVTEAMMNFSCFHCFRRRSLRNHVSSRGGHIVAAITGFWCRLHTHTPEPSPCGLPLYIHVSTRNGGSKPVGNTEGSDIERSDLGGNIDVLGNVTTDIGSCGTSEQVVFLIIYFTSGHLTTTTTSIDNVGSPGNLIRRYVGDLLLRSFDHNTTSIDNVGSPGGIFLGWSCIKRWRHRSNLVDDNSCTRSSTFNCSARDTWAKIVVTDNRRSKCHVYPSYSYRRCNFHSFLNSGFT